MRSALSTFRVSLARVRDIARELEKQSATALTDPSLFARHETTQCAATVILSGFFESFLKDTAETYSDDICNSGIPFASLDPAIRHAHFADGGAVLKAKATNSAKAVWITASVDDIARRVGGVVGTPAYELLWEAFADTGANPKAEQVGNFMKKFGVKDPWTRIAGKTRSSKNVLKSSLDSFMAIRNECAHSGSALHPPSPRDIRAYCVLLNTIAKGIVFVLEDHLIAMTTAPLPFATPFATVAPAVAVAAPPLPPTLPQPPSARPSRAARILGGIRSILRRIF